MTFKKSFWLCHYEENLSPSIIIKAPALWTPSFIQDYVIGECSLWMNFTESKDLRNIYIFFSTIFSVPVTYILLLLCSKNHDFFAKCFPMHVISIVRFPKNIPADFVTAGTLTKLPIERSTAKQKKKLQLHQSWLLLCTFTWSFFKIFRKFKNKITFSSRIQ